MKARFTIALATAATLACSRAWGAARLLAIAAAAERAIDGRVLPAPVSTPAR